MMIAEYTEDRMPAASARLAVGTAVERASAAGADRAAATRAARRAVAQLDVESAITLSLLHRSGAPPVAVAGADRRRLPYALSVAHRDGHAIAAAARSGAAIGVDVEREESIEAADLRMFATGAEQAGGVDATTLWVLKEAAWKALACAPSLPFQALELELERGVLTGVRLSGRRQKAHAHVWSPWQGWVAAVVVVSPREVG